MLITIKDADNVEESREVNISLNDFLTWLNGGKTVLSYQLTDSEVMFILRGVAYKLNHENVWIIRPVKQ